MAEDLQLSIDRMPTDAELGALLTGDPIDALLGLSRDRAVVDVGVELQARQDADEAAVRAALAAAQAAAELIAEHGPGARLTPQQRDALELFILLSSRPSLFVIDGAVRDRPANWPQLGRDSRLIEARIAGVGRIEAAPGGRDLAMGTGFLVAERRIMTNNHVVAALLGGSLTWWNSRPDWYAEAVDDANRTWPGSEQGPLFNLLGELGSEASSSTRVTGVAAHHPDVDLAVLEIAEVPQGGRRVALAARQPDALIGREVYVLGYPVAAPHHESDAVIDRIFGGAEGLRTKRCSPGKVIGRPSEFDVRHDASTLGGSSGSAVIDFELDEVIALHFAGKSREYNMAVPLWTLRNEPLLLDNGVVFGD